MSATLFREGPDLDELLAELDDEHDGRVRVVDVEYGRDGGVMGFFARRTVGVHYVVTDGGTAPAPLADVARDLEVPDNPLEAMLRAAEQAEAAEDMVLSGRVAAPAADATSAAGDNVEFARMLLDIAAAKAAERQAATPVPVVPVDAVPPAAAPLPAAPLPAVPAPLPALSPRVVDFAPSGRENVDHSPQNRPLATGEAATLPAEDAAPQEWQVTRAELLARARTRPVGAHRVADEPVAPSGAHRAPEPEPLAPAPQPVLSSPLPTAPAPVPVIEVPAPQPVAQPAPQPVAQPTPEPVLPQPVAQPAPQPVLPQPVAQPVAEPTATTATPVRTPLTLRRQLAEIGVPMSWFGDETGSAYEVIERLVRRIPTADRPDLGPGQLLVVAGPAAQAQAEASRLATSLRLDPAAIRTAGCGADPIRHRRQAAALELEVRGQREACIVVVATDSSGDTGGVADLEWAAGIIAALSPDQLVLVVEATCRVADVRRTARTLGPVTALSVVAAARAAGPAAVWELDLPVLSLDGAPATRGRWAALLIDRLADLDGC